MSKTIKIILAVIIISFLGYLSWIVFLPGHYTAPILMYHYINDLEPARSKLGISPKTFERQMRFLRERKYNVISLEKLAELIKNKEKIPKKTVAITFDDGYLDNYTQGFPILKKYNIPATFFIVVNRVGKRLGNDDYINWQQLKEMSLSELVAIGSHSLDHPNLTETISDEELKNEISESKVILENMLAVKINSFSYPFGAVNSKAQKLVRDAGYKLAVRTNSPRGYPNDDIYGLKRLRISENSGNMFIFWIETSGFYNYIKEMRDEY